MSFVAPVVGPVVPPTPEVTTTDLAVCANPDDGTQLQEYVSAALQHVILACGPITAGQWVFGAVQPPNVRRIAWSRFPGVRMVSLDGLTDPLGVDCLAQLTPNTDIHWRGQAILAPYLLAGQWQVTTTLQRPASDAVNLKLAVKIIAKNLYEVQRGMAARQGAFNDQASPPMWSGVPSRAKQLMKPYLRRTVG